MNIALFVAQCCPGKEPLQESLPPARQGGFDADAIAAAFASYMKKTFQYKLCEWEPDDKYYPKYLLLGGDKGILAYAVFKYAEGNTFQKGDLAMPLHATIKIVRYAGSRLDRPVFFLNFLNYVDQAGLYFETSEQIKDRLFHDTHCADQEKGLYYPELSLMGGFDDLRTLWEDLKRNGVRQR